MKKKILLLAAAVLLAGTFTGCGKEETVSLSTIKTDKYVTLGEYTGFEVSASETEITDEQVESTIESLKTQNLEMVEISDRPVQEGDTANIAFEGKLNGEVFEGGTSDSYDLVIGSGSFIEGFEEGVVGMNTGETKDLTLTFPENYGKEELNGQEVVFTVTVNSVKNTPELTDENVPQLNSQCKTVEELRQTVYVSLQQQAQYDYDTQVENDLIEKMAANCTFKKDPPKTMVDEYVARSKKNLETAASYYGMSFADLLQAVYQVSEDKFDETVRPGCIESAQKDIMLQAIANKENLNPSQEDIDQAMQQEADELGYETVDAYKEVINTDNYKDYTMVKKVLAFVKEKSTITDAAQ